MREKLLILIAFFVTSLSWFHTSQAGGFSIIVQPSMVDFGIVDPGFSSSYAINVTNTGQADAKVEVSVMADRGYMWVFVNQSILSIAAGTSRSLEISVMVPNNATPDAYDISVTFTQVEETLNEATAIGSTSCRVKFTVKGLRIASFYVADVEKPNPAQVIAILKNFYEIAIGVNVECPSTPPSENQLNSSRPKR
jgi:hypothetical protein